MINHFNGLFVAIFPVQFFLLNITSDMLLGENAKLVYRLQDYTKLDAGYKYISYTRM